VLNLWRALLRLMGILLSLVVIIAFTRWPYDAQQWLGNAQVTIPAHPAVLIFLGGSGMPSESNLIRLYYLAAWAKKNPSARVLLLHPPDTAVIEDMKMELMLRGIDTNRIIVMSEGRNTREQALCMAQNYPALLQQQCLVITSPENVKRSVRTFRKLGFSQLYGQGAFERPLMLDLTFSKNRTKVKPYMPDISANLAVRYNFWNYLKLEITCLRECSALFYYKLNGWI